MKTEKAQWRVGGGSDAGKKEKKTIRKKARKIKGLKDAKEESLQIQKKKKINYVNKLGNHEEEKKINEHPEVQKEKGKEFFKIKTE